MARAEARNETAMSAAVVLAAGMAWAAGVHLALGISVPSLALTIALVTAAAFGIGYELGDAGLGTALFIGLAIGGTFLSVMLALNGVPGAGMTIALGALPALLAAPAAYAGGMRKEQ